MIRKINRHPSQIDLRKFGLTILIGFGLIGLAAYHKGAVSAAVWIWSVSTLVMVLSYIAPGLARPVYILWMGIGFVIGTVMSRVVLTVIFFGILTPVALFFRLIGRDALKKYQSSYAEPTYWQPHPKINDKSYYDHLF